MTSIAVFRNTLRVWQSCASLPAVMNFSYVIYDMTLYSMYSRLNDDDDDDEDCPSKNKWKQLKVFVLASEQ